MAAPTHRLRSKSRPRGKSPDPKMLKKMHKKMKGGGTTTAGDKRPSDGDYVTAPPKVKKPTPASGSKQSDNSDKNSSLRRHISFGDVTETKIEAENAPGKSMDSKEADDILAAIKDPFWDEFKSKKWIHVEPISFWWDLAPCYLVTYEQFLHYSPNVWLVFFHATPGDPQSTRKER